MIKILKRLIILLTLIVLLFDMSVYILGTKGYYFTFLKPTGNLIPTVLTIVSLLLLTCILKIKIYWIITGGVVSLLFLGTEFLENFGIEYSYEHIKPPTGKETLIIEYRNFKLGETDHFYNFYRKTDFPNVIKKLNKEMVSIMTRRSNDSALEVLGVNNAVWKKGKGVTFKSKYAETKVVFPY